jgi:hypothetical protein
MSEFRHHTTQSVPAYRPEKAGFGLAWALVVGGLVAVALLAVLIRPVCAPDDTAGGHAGFGVRHEQRGTEWYHCEPWIRYVLTK